MTTDEQASPNKSTSSQPQWKRRLRPSSHFLAYFSLIWLVASFLTGFVGLIVISTDNVSNTQLLVAVALAGAAGAAVHASTALTNYIGNRRYLREWTTYFMLRPLLGAVMAVVLYVGLRAAFVESRVPASSLNYYGIVGLSALAGFFSGSALASLINVFDTLLDPRASSRPGEPAREKAVEIRQLDRYHGFLLHEQERIADSNKTILRVWLQSEPPKNMKCTEINIGEGDAAKRVTFRVNVYPEECDVEPPSCELVAGTDIPSSERLRFVLTCPAGVDPEAYIELSQRSRTVAVVALKPTAGRYD